MDLEKGGKSLVSHKALFHAFSRYATQLVTPEEQGIRLFIKGLNFELLVLSMHTTSIGKSFNGVMDFVKKVEGVRYDGQTKVWTKKSMTTSNFQGSYSTGSKRPTLAAWLIQPAMPNFTVITQVP